jgi:hypothetical protein
LIAKVKAILVTAERHGIFQMKNVVKILSLGCILACCTSQKQIVPDEGFRLKYIGEYNILPNQIFNNTTVGGLSGLDYDAENDVYYLISDDRSDMNPARFYTAKIHFNEKGIDSVRFLSVLHLLQRSGTRYPGFNENPFLVVDPEGIRYNPKTKGLAWVNEGEKFFRNDTVILINPGVINITKEGKYIDSFVLPSNMQIEAGQRGPRRNGAFEGLSFANNFQTLFVALEEPLYGDGSRAGLNDSAGWIRIIKYDVRTRKPVGQYAYQIDPVAQAPDPADGFRVNGVSEILSINNHQLLVVERSFSAGRKQHTIKLYLAELKGARDISNNTSPQSFSFKQVKKQLLLNLDSLGIHIDNIEGVTFGPRLPDGRQTLIFVSDNNFAAGQPTQFLLFVID